MQWPSCEGYTIQNVGSPPRATKYTSLHHPLEPHRVGVQSAKLVPSPQVHLRQRPASQRETARQSSIETITGTFPLPPQTPTHPNNATNYNPNIASEQRPPTQLSLLPPDHANPPCLAAAPPQAALHFHANDHTLRRQHIPAPHDFAGAHLPLDKGHKEQPAVEPVVAEIGECGRG